MTTMIRRDRNQPATRSAANVWDPFRIMEGMLNWDPYSSMLPTSGTNVGQVFLPSFEVKETKDGYIFVADLPGVKEEDLEISFTGNQLVISGKRDAVEIQESDRYHLYERAYGRFTRTFTLPDGTNADQTSAHLKDGVLTLTVGKRPEVQPRRIQLSAKSKGTA
jgi:HSP20 family protein